MRPIPEKGSLASFASPPGLYSRFTVFGCISLLCLCLILILASYFNYLTPQPLLLRRFQSTQSQLVTRKDWWSSPRAWSQWIRVNWPYYKSTYLRKLLTKPKKGQLQLSIPFSRELSHSGMGVPSKTWPKAYLFHLNFTFSETRLDRGRARVQLQPIPGDIF